MSPIARAASPPATPMVETFTESVRRRFRDRQLTCPTCGQVTGSSLRALGEATGVPFNNLARFLKGGDMVGRNLDRVVAYLDTNESTHNPAHP